MSATTKVQFVDLSDAGRSGCKSGSYWASVHATKSELSNLADHWLTMDSTETNDAFGPPGVFLRMVRASDDRDDEPDRRDVHDLWIDIGGEDEPREYQYSCQFWDGFVEGALNVFVAEGGKLLSEVVPMKPSTDTIVRVRRQWNDWRIGEVLLDCLRDFHWRRESGGVGVTSPYPMLYARMWCDSLVGGEIAHGCEHGEGPHEILVCMCKVDNKLIFKALEKLVNR